jgi:L-alanine-DL-glutamate epimerase-like enolase superfamily enzyme
LELAYDVIELRTRRPFTTARTPAPAARQSVVVHLRTRDGAHGTGEAAPTPYYGETAATVIAALEQYRAVLHAFDAPADHSPFELERIEAAIDTALGRNPAARAAVSAALHDLTGRMLGQPVWRLWGLSPQAAPLSSCTIGINEPDVMRQDLAEKSTYPIIKVKVGTDRDTEILELIRKDRPDATLYVDANTAWTAKQALAKLPLLRDVGVSLIEQPFKADDYGAFRLLRGNSEIPVIADESCRTARDIPLLDGCVDGINIKLEKCGSLREALRMVHTARAHHMKVMLGCMVSSTLAIAATLQLAPLADYADLDAATYLTDDPFTGPGLQNDGSLRFNQEPGLGVRPRTVQR